MTAWISHSICHPCNKNSFKELLCGVSPPHDESLLFRQKCPKPFPPVRGPKGVPPPPPRIRWRGNSLRSNSPRREVDSGLRLRRTQRWVRWACNINCSPKLSTKNLTKNLNPIFVVGGLRCLCDYPLTGSTRMPSAPQKQPRRYKKVNHRELNFSYVVFPLIV